MVCGCPCYEYHFDTEIGTEELAHFEMVGAMVYQLTKNLSMDQIQEQGFAPYYVDHTLALWPQAAGGIPFNACEFQSKGDVITDLMEDLAADGNGFFIQPYPFPPRKVSLFYSECPMNPNWHIPTLFIAFSYFYVIN